MSNSERIRNFVITAHIDHGKSTLADRFLEITKTIEARRMMPQYLDQLELERERGITIKMAPVRMAYRSKKSGEEYVLNLIDTPGHSDFAYEVSRALLAVEGAILLVDAAKGIQAQTLANFEACQRAGLRIIGAVNKIDLNPPNLEDNILDLANLLNVDPSEIFRVSGRTGAGAEELLEAVIEKLPPPKHAIAETSKPEGDHFQALIFDSRYDDHKGALAYVRVMNGKIERGTETELAMAHTKFKVKETGYFSPGFMSSEEIAFGEIGYVATGIKDPDLIKIGDTVGAPPLPGYKEPKPVVFVSFYPNEDGEYDNLKLALRRFKLNDPSLTFESDFNEVLGRGFKCGFLGQLHFEVTSERLLKEYKIETINSFPSVAYRVKARGEWKTIENPKDFPDDYEEVWQPMVRLEILTMPEYLGSILKLKEHFVMEGIETKTMGARMLIMARMPLADLVRDFDDRLKSVSGGYASFTYELIDQEKADVTKLEIVVATESVPGLLRVVNKKDVEYEGRQMVEKLKDLLPRQQFAQALQAKAMGRIIARETIPALKKDVTGYLYGGDRSRKIKLWEKQKRGKERLKKMGRVNLSADIFKELLKKQK